MSDNCERCGEIHPYCGCTEIERLTARIEQLEAQLAKADALVNISNQLIDGYGFTSDGSDDWREVCFRHLEQLESAALEYLQSREAAK